MTTHTVNELPLKSEPRTIQSDCWLVRVALLDARRMRETVTDIVFDEPESGHLLEQGVIGERNEALSSHAHNCLERLIVSHCGHYGS